MSAGVTRLIARSLAGGRVVSVFAIHRRILIPRRGVAPCAGDSRNLLDTFKNATAMTPTTAISNSFRKHGTFIYGASDTINDYGSTSLLVAAMQRAGMTHAWVRIHGTNRYPSAERKIIQALVGEMQNSGINVAGWGWCQGASVQSDIRLAVNESKFFGLTNYLADIENGVNNSNWSATEIQTFCTAVRSGIGGSFGITTFPLIDWHEPELMQAALSSVDLFAP
jgi:hypothetical protein